MANSYCRPVKAIEVGERVYRTASPAAKEVARLMAGNVVVPKVRSAVGLRGEQFTIVWNNIRARQAEIEQKAYRRILSIMQKFFNK